MELDHGAPSVLEGLPQAFPRLLPDRRSTPRPRRRAGLFRQINKQTGNRLRQQLVDEVTREPVESRRQGPRLRGREGRYILVDDDEIEAIAIESNHTIDIDRFVPRAQIDERYLDSPYYIAPNDKVGTRPSR